MSSPSKYRIGQDTEFSEVDLDNEDVRLPDGRRLTEELAEEIAQDTIKRAQTKNLIPGGKSLSGDGSHSPVVQVRVSAASQRALRERARAEKRSMSAVARDAIERYLAS